MKKNLHVKILNLKDDGPFVDEVFYGKEILSYESVLEALGVIVDARAGCALMAQYLKGHPTIGDYCRLWIMWQDSNSTPTPKDFVAFFEFVEKNWSTEIGKYLAGSITKVPACPGDQILLLKKQDVFIPDDFLLEDLFKKKAEQPLFVWMKVLGHS
ncbi:hypothetical protein E2562_010138 [Oryza meyeriana var. granulata]|uniref:Uncharacterized protein n=1 Tax=Oryza meyeriana var. granulata TaxID=110450 RepID=A0A6G1EIJ4_9ORYZ|nr:hypothetical protein E2562_010138 [Oryza meyeriana var. granulata]